MTKPRHTEFVRKRAADLERGDVLPRGKNLAVTVDRAVPGTCFGIAVMTVHTQAGTRRTMLAGKRVRLISPTTGPTLVATRIAEAKQRALEETMQQLAMTGAR